MEVHRLLNGYNDAVAKIQIQGSGGGGPSELARSDN